MAVNSKSILLVEDNRDHEELTLRALRKHNVVASITVARDGAEALELLFPAEAQPHRDNPDLILLDLQLPRVDGLQVLGRIRSDPRTRLIPVVILTSSDEERDIISSYTLGANSYIRKPVDFEQFVQAARQLGVYWLTMNESPGRHR